VSVTAGTIFDRSRIPLADWFTAIWFMTNQKYGVSALGLQRQPTRYRPSRATQTASKHNL